MKILFVAPRFPLPANTGAKIRTYNLMKELCKENEITFLSFSFDKDNDYKNSEALKKQGIKVNLVYAKEKINLLALLSDRPVSVAKYYSTQMADNICKMLDSGDFDIVHFDHLHMGQYRDCVDGKPWVLDDHNVESVILKRLYEKEGNFLKRLILKNEYKKMEKLERKICCSASLVSVVSEQDRANLRQICADGIDAEVIPNGVDTEYFKPLTVNRKPYTVDGDYIVFTGSMDWLPNSDAVEYFCKDILPLVWKEKEDVKFYIVGKNPPKKIMEFGKKDKRIVVTGEVDDVRPYVEEAKVFVAPMRIGGGTRLKILEAMSMQKAVVSTMLGAEGIDYTEDIDIVLANNPQIFANKVISLVKDGNRRAEIGLNARRLVCNKYDWNIIGKKLNRIYAEVAQLAH